jgi:cysteinyl-tRNA synthetase
MSKSLGNFFTLRDLLARGYAGREIRYVLINGHYRQPLNFTFDALDAGRASLARIDEFADCLSEAVATNPGSGRALPAWAVRARDAFDAAVSNDLNIPEALAALFAVVREGNGALQTGALSVSGAAAVQDLLASMDRVLGVLSFGRRPADEVPPDRVADLLANRAVARREKRWAESDRLRDEIADLGWEVRDGKDGQKVKRRIL